MQSRLCGRARAAAALKSAAKANQWKLVGRQRGFLIQSDDGVGIVADVAAKLADANISITAIDGICAGDDHA